VVDQQAVLGFEPETPERQFGEPGIAEAERVIGRRQGQAEAEGRVELALQACFEIGRTDRAARQRRAVGRREQREAVLHVQCGELPGIERRDIGDHLPEGVGAAQRGGEGARRGRCCCGFCRPDQEHGTVAGGIGEPAHGFLGERIALGWWQ
jgi:hypothetical protein